VVVEEENGFGIDLVCRLDSKVEVISSCSDEEGASERRIVVEVYRNHVEEESENDVGIQVKEVDGNRNDGEVEENESAR